jgi:hypothetical protein
MRAGPGLGGGIMMARPCPITVAGNVMTANVAMGGAGS